MKKILSVILAVICISNTLIFTASAADNSTMQPYYVGISQVSASLDISSTSLGADLAKCLGLVMLYDGYSADVTLSLQRSSDKSSWTTLKDWEASGEEEVSIYKEYFVVNGYYYRLNIRVFVYDSNDELVEIVSKQSPVWP